MATITRELLKKRAEHNEGMVSTLEEVIVIFKINIDISSSVGPDQDRKPGPMQTPEDFVSLKQLDRKDGRLE